MENELDLTLRLGFPSRTVETHLNLHTPNPHQGINVNGGRRVNNTGGEINSRRRSIFGDDFVIEDDEGARNNVNANIRFYNMAFEKFAGIGETLNFSTYPMQPSPAPAPETPNASEYVLIDVPARRARRNNDLAVENANAVARQRREYGGYCEAAELKTCTNMNCNANFTPMWRRGPLGPKSLCNACGIKFRKEEERRSKRDE